MSSESTNNYFKFKNKIGSPYQNHNKKPYKFAHTPGNSQGIGDYYGTGIVAKLGRIRNNPVEMSHVPKNLKKPPRSLV